MDKSIMDMMFNKNPENNTFDDSAETIFSEKYGIFGKPSDKPIGVLEDGTEVFKRPDGSYCDEDFFDVCDTGIEFFDEDEDFFAAFGITDEEIEEYLFGEKEA